MIIRNLYTTTAVISQPSAVAEIEEARVAQSNARLDKIAELIWRGVHGGTLLRGTTVTTSTAKTFFAFSPPDSRTR